MSIDKLGSGFLDTLFSKTKTVGQKVDEVIDVVNAATDGTETFANITVTDTATIENLNAVSFAAEDISSSGGIAGANITVSDYLVIPKNAVTQITSISTAVTVTKQTGVITTVSSTIAANASASFTVNYALASASSIVMLTASTAGTGIPVATISSITSGSFVVKLYNAHATLAFNNVIIINYIIAI